MDEDGKRQNEIAKAAAEEEKVSLAVGVGPRSAEVVARRAAFYSLSPRTVAAVALACAVAALTALGIVAGVREADTLSTVALAVAITAFVLQMLVFVAQTTAGAQATRRSEELSADTKTLLAEIGSAAKQTQVLVGEQLAQLLKSNVEMVQQAARTDRSADGSDEQQSLLSGGAEPAARGEPSSMSAQPDETARAMAQLDFVERSQVLLDRLGRASGGETSSVGDFLAGGREKARRVARLLETYPDQSTGERYVQVLEELSGPAARRLRELAQDVVNMGKMGGMIGLVAENSRGAEELRSKDLAEGFSMNAPGAPTEWERFTDDGREAARILVATGDPPLWAAVVHNKGL